MQLARGGGCGFFADSFRVTPEGESFSFVRNGEDDFSFGGSIIIELCFCLLSLAGEGGSLLLDLL